MPATMAVPSPSESGDLTTASLQHLIWVFTVCKKFSNFSLGISKSQLKIFQYIVWGSLFSLKWIGIFFQLCNAM